MKMREIGEVEDEMIMFSEEGGIGRCGILFFVSVLIYLIIVSIYYVDNG